jgi:hypothetical protein
MFYSKLIIFTMQNRPNYIVQPQLYHKRAKDNNQQTEILKKWIPLNGEQNMGGNINFHLRFDRDEKAFVFIDRDKMYDQSIKYPHDKYELFCNTISSALVLYRCVCLGFTPQIMTSDGYKTIWSVPIEHIASKHCLVFQDFKAGVDINTRAHKPEQMPDDFRADVLEILTFIVSDNVTHPYDLTIAGSVA